MTDEILTTEEAKRYLKIHKATLYKLAKQRKIPASKVGKKWRFKKSKIDAWLEKQEDAR